MHKDIHVPRQTIKKHEFKEDFISKQIVLIAKITQFYVFKMLNIKELCGFI